MSTFDLSQQFAHGTPEPRLVVEKDYPCEYALLEYLAIVTAGQPVGVGYFYCPVPMTPAEFAESYPGLEFNSSAHKVYELGVVVLPDIGIWLCVPVFGDARESLGYARAQLEALACVMERTVDNVPVHIALIAVLDDQVPNLRGVDPSLYYDTTLYSDVVGQLTRRARPPAADFSAFAEELFETVQWGDMKTRDCVDWRVPRWMAEAARIQALPDEAWA